MPNEQHTRILLGAGLTLDIDHQGYLLSKPYEGTLGLLIHAHVPPHGHCALKIPRLVADTPQENHYISHLLEEERVNCAELFQRARYTADCLLQADHPSFSPLAVGAGPAREAGFEKQHGQWIMVQFAADGIRFIGVQVRGGSLSFFPSTPEGLDELSPESLAEAIRRSRRSAEVLHEPLIIEPRQEAGTTGWQVCILKDLDPTTTRGVWYLGLPSVAYRWADRTLEEFIDRAERFARPGSGQGDPDTGFDWREAFDLNTRVLRGIKALHASGFIHGDLRPANVMQIGNEPDASSFYLTDYASFGRSQPVVGPKIDGRASKDHTQLGPVVAGGRVSPFYPQERQSAPETESADAALLFPVEPTDARSDIVVILGWRADMFRQSASFASDELSDAAERARRVAFDTMRDDAPLERYNHMTRSSRDLRGGDRLRLRDLVLEVDRPLSAGNTPFRAIMCHGPGWVIHQERVLLERRQPLTRSPEFQLVLLPKVVEIWQWSAATDLYSFGVLVLYTLFNVHWNELQTKIEGGIPTAEDDHEVDRTTSSVPDAVSREDVFKTMIETIASVPYARTIWGPLVDLCDDLESLSARGLTPTSWQVALAHRVDDGTGKKWVPYEGNLSELQIRGILSRIRSEVRNDNKSGSGVQDPSIKVTPMETLLYHTLIGVGRLTQTAPGLDVVLQALGRNVAAFALVVHFALSCIYRAEDLRVSEEAPPNSQPFCADRASSPSSGVAERALDRLRQIDDLVKGHLSPMYETFTCEPDQIIAYQPSSAAFLRLTNAELNAKLTEVNHRLAEANRRRESAKTNIQLTGEALEHTRAKLNAAESAAQEQGAELERREQALHDAKVCFRTIEHLIGQLAPDAPKVGLGKYLPTTSRKRSMIDVLQAIQKVLEPWTK